MEEEVGLVDEAHVRRLLSQCKHLPAHVEWPQFHVLASAGSVGLTLVVRHHLVSGRPHAQVVDHLELYKIKKHHNETIVNKDLNSKELDLGFLSTCRTS